MSVNGGTVSECVRRWLHPIGSLIFYAVFVVNAETVATTVVVAKLCLCVGYLSSLTYGFGFFEKLS